MKLPQTWSEFGFAVEFTGDQSPTLRLQDGESMHHSGGAAAETELIYGRVIQQVYAKILKPHFTSVGLGLGYVELIVARESLRNQNLSFSMESFEIVPELRELFLTWLRDETLGAEIQSTYDLVLKFVLKDSTLPAADLKRLLIEKHLANEFRIAGALTPQTNLTSPSHALIFDAFSAKTNPDLWSDDFLVNFFKSAMAPDALISTYACRANLKAALRAANFEVHIREGFQGKRNSTLGFRGILGVE
jgi:hypothetical protein